MFYSVNQPKNILFKRNILLKKKYEKKFNLILFLNTYDIESLLNYNNLILQRLNWFYHFKIILIRNFLFNKVNKLLCDDFEKKYGLTKKNIQIIFKKKFLENWLDLKIKKFKNYFFFKYIVFFKYIYNLITVKENSFELVIRAKNFSIISDTKNIYYCFPSLWSYRYYNSILISREKNDLLNTYKTVLSKIIKNICIDSILETLLKNSKIPFNTIILSRFKLNSYKLMKNIYFKSKQFKLFFFNFLANFLLLEIVFFKEYNHIVNMFLLNDKLLDKDVYFSFFYVTKITIINNFINLLFIYNKNQFVI